MLVRSTLTALVTAATVAVVLTGCSADTPTPAPTKKSVSRTSPAPTQTAPEVAADDVISGNWATFDRVLISDDVINAFGASGVLKSGVTDVPVYVPGDGAHTIPLTADTGPGDVQQRLVNVGGADGNLMLIVATSTRIPAHGLTKDEGHNQIDSYDISSGHHIATYEFTNSEDEELVVNDLAATRSDAVAVDFMASYLGTSITGLNMRTGEKTWDDTSIPSLKARTVVGTSYGTFATTSDTGGKPGDESSCYRADGFDTATGKMLWSVDAANIPDKDPSFGFCARVRTEVLDQANVNRANTDSIGANFEVVLGMSSSDGNGDEYRNFDGITGTELTTTDIAGQLDLLGGYTASQEFITDFGPLTVKDITTGKTIYTVTEQQQDDLDLQLQGLFSGWLYTKTTDGTPIVDVASGKVVADNTTNMPVQTVGKYTRYEDGTVSLDPHLSVASEPTESATTSD